MEWLIADAHESPVKLRQGGSLAGVITASEYKTKREHDVLRFGSGCKRGGDDCFKCPLPDCQWLPQDDMREMKAKRTKTG